MQERSLPEGWTSVARPPSLFRRFQFESYAHTRAFLDGLATLSEQTGCFPDLSFGTTYVNVTLHAADGAAPGAELLDYAARASALASAGPAEPQQP